MDRASRLLSVHTIALLQAIDELEEIVLDGSRIPFSGGRLVNEQDAIEIMQQVRTAARQIARDDQRKREVA